MTGNKTSARAHKSAILLRPLSTLLSALARRRAARRRIRARQSLLRELAARPDWHLEDIGLNRGEIEKELAEYERR